MAEKCMVCGKVVDVLTYVHMETHGLSKKEYREKYGKNIVNNFEFVNKVPYTEVEIYESLKHRKDTK